MLNGTMVHEVFQKAAMARDFSPETLSKLADQALCSPQHLGLMYGRERLLTFKLSSFSLFQYLLVYCAPRNFAHESEVGN